MYWQPQQSPTLRLALSRGTMGGWWSFVSRRPFHPWESASLRSSDKCCRCLSFLLPSWSWLGDSHATTQCLNKRVCLIQLSPQGCAKWALVPCDRDNERAEKRRRRAVGCRGLKRETWAHSDVHTSFFLYSFRAPLCPRWPCSFSVKWNILHSNITVQMGSMRDTERLGIVSSVTSEFLHFSTTKCFQIWVLFHCWGQCVTQKVCGRWKCDSMSDSTG